MTISAHIEELERGRDIDLNTREALRLLAAKVEEIKRHPALSIPPLETAVSGDTPRAREKAILEECDMKLEGLQGYLRGDCQVIQIRNLIAKRMWECETPSQPTPTAAETTAPSQWTSPTRPTVAELIEGLKQQNQTAIVVVDARVGDRYEVCNVTRLLLGGIGSFSGTPIVVIEAHFKKMKSVKPNLPLPIHAVPASNLDLWSSCDSTPCVHCHELTVTSFNAVPMHKSCPLPTRAPPCPRCGGSGWDSDALRNCHQCYGSGFELGAQQPPPSVTAAPDAGAHEASQIPVCPRCKNEIDPDVCYCGEYVKQHGYNSGHTPVPMGCTCGYAEQPLIPAAQPGQYQHYMPTREQWNAITGALDATSEQNPAKDLPRWILVRKSRPSVMETKPFKTEGRE